MSSGRGDVDAWLDSQSHDVIEGARAVRAAIGRAVPGVRESIKWQAPNFALDDDFATFSMRRAGVLQVILHTGAKPKPELPEITVDDLDGRLKWASRNRAIITFRSDQDVNGSLPMLEKVLSDWVRQLG